jgi:hypothetical protein
LDEGLRAFAGRGHAFAQKGCGMYYKALAVHRITYSLLYLRC